jgi:pyrimidine operon attenuation protein/uracil phosphoribosyltransferase
MFANTQTVRGYNFPEVWEMESNETTGRAWSKDFPKVTTLADYKAFKEHPDYEAAKGGDINAAGRLVQGLMRGEISDRLIAMAKKHPDAILLGIHAVEATGKNEIPQALVKYIGAKTGLNVDNNIVQTNVVGHTSAGQNVRLYNRPKFEGDIQRGRKYILVDDMVTMGGTLGEMRNYIESRGGTVVDMITLSTRSDQNATVALTEVTRIELESVFGVESTSGVPDMTPLSDFLKESGIYGGNYKAFTESEARALLHAKGLDEARNRRIKARQAGSEQDT